jgi:transposase
LRRIIVFATAVLADLHEQLKAFYSDIGRPSVDPELMIRMLLVGYCYGIRHERRLCQEVALHLAYRWFCKLDLDDKVPHHSTFSVNRLGRFRESEILRHIFERVVTQCMAAGLVKGEGFAVDASVMEANASRYYGKAPDELDWSDAQRQKRAVAEYLAGLEAEARVQEGGDGRGGGSDGTPTAKPDRKPPKVISPSDPSSAWTAKANKRVQFGYGLNYLIDVEHAVIIDVEPTPARTFDEVASTRTMLERTEQRLDLKPDWLAADTAYGTGKLLAWLLGKNITPHIPVWERYPSADGMFSRSDFAYDAERDVYVCPNGRLLRTSGTVHDGRVRNYLSQPQDCRARTLKQRSTRAPFKKIARDINEDARNHARSLRHAGVRAIEQCAQESRNAFCAPEGPTWLRAHAPSRPHRRPRRVSPRRHRAEPQDNGAASTRSANRWSVCVDGVRGLAGRFWCSPIRQRPTRNRPKSPPNSKANYGEAFFDSIGQNAKHSNRANAFRFTPELRHCSEQLACLKGAISRLRHRSKIKL